MIKRKTGGRKTWAQRIAAAEKRGKFTKQDINLATGWNTCAVGEAVGYPATDKEAFVLIRKNPGLDNGIGIRFIKAVQEHKFAEATKVLNEIKAAVANG